jgi:hypothetical protein
MIDGTLPSDTQGAIQALKQRKLILLELQNEMTEKGYTKGYEVSGLISNKVESIDSRIDSGDLWELGDE